MNNKQGNMYAAIMVALIIFMVGLTVVNFIKPEVTSARTLLNCATPAAITDGTKLMCLNIDIVVPYFIILIFAIAGGYITEKLVI